MKEVTMPYQCVTSIVAYDIARKLSSYYTNETFYIFQAPDKRGIEFIINDNDKPGRKYKDFKLISTWSKGTTL